VTFVYCGELLSIKSLSSKDEGWLQSELDGSLIVYVVNTPQYSRNEIVPDSPTNIKPMSYSVIREFPRHCYDLSSMIPRQ
jgi:hypothetical protein